jgi:hypothetical protein
MELIAKEDVIIGEIKDSGKDVLCGKHNYRNAILRYIDGWKTQIKESHENKIEIKMRYIRDNILKDELKNKNETTIYSRMKVILLEFGIKVVMRHHYGLNLVMTLVDDDEIVSELEYTRIKGEQTAKKAGYSNWSEYQKNKKAYREKHISYDKKLDCTRYLGSFIEERIMKAVFEDAEKNPIPIGGLGSGLWDWKLKNGKLIRYVASCLHYNIKTDSDIGKEYDWEGWQWAILRNNVPDFFLLMGYGDSRIDLDVVSMWIVPGKDVIRGKPFWNREAFSIRIDKEGQIENMEKYSVGEDKLDRVRKILRQDNYIMIDDTFCGKELKEKIIEWYRTYFR